MSLSIVKYPDSRLKGVCRSIDVITDEHRRLAEEMAKTMYKADGIGLAAPQIGENIRLIVVDVSGPEKRTSLMTFVNPKLTTIPGSGTTETEEGCLSVPGYRSKVKRPAKVLLEALDLDGNPVRMEAEGLLAVCLQHEVDHLEGKLFIDHISRLKRSLFEDKLRKRMAQER